MGKFMLRLIGMYIPFVLVILGIGACSFVYQDELLGRFNQSEEVIEDVGQPSIDAEPIVDQVTPKTKVNTPKIKLIGLKGSSDVTNKINKVPKEIANPGPIILNKISLTVLMIF